jgi:hypothetical protein
MTPHLDRYLQRLRFYKRAFVFFAVVNAFSLSASLVVGFRYFAFKRSAVTAQQALLDKASEADRAVDILNHLHHDLATKHLNLKSRSDELEVLAILDRWQTARQLVQHLGVTVPDSLRLLGEDSSSNSALELLLSRLTEMKAATFNELHENLASFSGVQKELVLTGLLTLIFGFLLPTAIMVYAGRAINALRKEMQSAIVEFLRSWKDATSAHGPGAFKDPDFWLKILLLVGQYSGQMSSHPVAQIAGEIAFVVRQELQRAGPSAA